MRYCAVTDPLVQPSSGPWLAGTAGPVTEWPPIDIPRVEEVLVGRSAECNVILEHATVSRRHLRLAWLGDRLRVQDLGSRMGTFVNGDRIQEASLESGDVLRIGGSPPYEFENGRLLPNPERIGLRIELRDLGVTGSGRPLLSGVNLSFGPDQFIGLLGPSGSGKSLLLECLSSARVPSAGDMAFESGRLVRDELEYYRSQLGEVAQTDFIHESLTVEENLRFAAGLRLPNLTRAARQDRVAEAIRLVDLQERRRTQASRLSGGQKKRLSVAIELLRRPRILVLDEPTSGLDPSLEARLMNLLRRLTRRGMTVVCSTHTLDTIHFFDSVALLGRSKGVGRIAYFGGAEGILPKFGVHHLADLFEKLQDIPDSVTRPDTVTEANASGDDARAGSRRASFVSHRSTAGESVQPEAVRVKTGSFWLQVWVLFRRTLLGFGRDPASLTLALAQPVVLATVIVLSQHNQSTATFIHCFLVIAALWMGMTLTIRELVRERPLYFRDRLAGASPDAYLLAKVSAAILFGAVQVALLQIATRVLVPLLITSESASIARADLLHTGFVLSFVVLLLSSVVGAALGLIISAACRTERAAVSFLPLVILPQLLLSRVGYGDVGEGWTSVPPRSPFCPISLLGAFVTGEHSTFGGRLCAILSLFFPTRPLLVILDSRNKLGWSGLTAEWLHFTSLMLMYSLFLYLVFHRSDRVMKRRG